MKRQKACAFIALLIAGCLHASAQNSTPPLNEPDYNKPKIFADLPNKATLRLPEAEALLNLAVGAQVNTTIADGFMVAGTVVSKATAVDQSSQSIVVKCAARGGAVFYFARIKNTDGGFSYRGRMLSKGSGDALEIVKEGATYVLQKKGYYDLINE